MNPALKQRLVGAALLVALAVIFLPMLLDGSGARERLDAEIEIPDKPEAPESYLDQPDPAPTELASTDTSDEAAPDTTTAADTEAVQQTSAAAEPEAETQPEPEPEPAPEAPADAAPEKGWIVQVGSFRKETNALVLRDRLRQQGYDAHSDRTVTQGQTWWRVRVGPVGQRSEAAALERRIEAARGSEALLMSYP